MASTTAAGSPTSAKSATSRSPSRRITAERERESDAACLQCHPSFEGRTEHTHHTADSSGSRCQNCHMPHTTYGLLKAIRSHKIDSPSVQASLATGRPNACNLCHLDKSLAWTQDALERGWGERIALPRGLERRFGKELGRSVGEAWLAHPNGSIRVVAAAAYARSSLEEKRLSQLIGFLNEPNAYLRTRSLQIVERIIGREFSESEYSVAGSPAQRNRQVQRLLERHARGDFGT